MLEEILLSQHECVIMGDFNLPNIDWTLQRPIPAPGNKLMQLLADNNLTQEMHETTRQNNILDLVISTEEEIIVNLKITDKTGDHQAITFSIKTEKGNIASEKKTTTLEEQISMQFGLNMITIPSNNLLFEIMPSLDLKFSRAESMKQAEDTSRKEEPPSTIHHGSTVMSNRLLEGRREPMKQKEGSTMEKLSKNT